MSPLLQHISLLTINNMLSIPQSSCLSAFPLCCNSSSSSPSPSIKPSLPSSKDYDTVQATLSTVKSSSLPVFSTQYFAFPKCWQY